MNNDTYKVTVSKDLEDLIPVFMSNRHKEVQTLGAALSAGDFEQLRQLGHRMKGVGNSYGFERISLFGKRVEEAAAGRDKAAVEACIAEYRDYLAKLQVAYE